MHDCFATEVENYHSVMEKQDLEGLVDKVNAVERKEYPHDMDRGIYPVLDCIFNVAHFYTNHIYVPRVAAYDECPGTPTF